METAHDIVTLTINPALDLSTSVEELRPFSKLRCGTERRDPGGGGINVARVAARLGGEPLAVFPAGGPIGRYLAEMLAAENFKSAAIPIAGNTREDVTVMEMKSGQQYRFVLAGPHLSQREWERVSAEFSACLSPSSLAVASGSLAPGVPEDFYAKVAKSARDRGARFMLDCSGRSLATALETGVYLIKPNLRELRGLAGEALPDQESWLSACRGIISSGKAEVVALSLAGEGALFVGKDFALRVTAPKVTPLSTVGAGDSFLGGFVSALSMGLGLVEVCRRAVAAGTAALLAPGTDLCRAVDVERLLGEVAVIEI
jgi:6-phosphofructokinase 2